MASRTVYLGQFLPERAEAIVAELDAAGISWWEKRPGRFSQLVFTSEWGVRLFVDAARLDEARSIVDRTPEP